MPETPILVDENWSKMNKILRMRFSLEFIFVITAKTFYRRESLFT